MWRRWKDCGSWSALAGVTTAYGVHDTHHDVCLEPSNGSLMNMGRCWNDLGQAKPETMA